MRTSTAAIAAALFLGLTACSDPAPAPESSAAQGPKPASDDGKAALEKAVRAYSDAYFKPDPTAAHGMLSKRCQAKADLAVFKAIVDQAAKDYGPQAVKTLTVDQISGDLGRVSYTYGVPKLDQSGQPWAREDGQWRYDAC